MQKQLNMKPLIKSFFDSADGYIQKMRGLYVDEMDLDLFNREMPKFYELRRVAESIPDTTEWDDRYKKIDELIKMSVRAGLFMKPNSYDNSTYRAFFDFIRCLADYYGRRIGDKKILAAYKNWCYNISNNRLKDFIYPFVPVSFFAKRAQEGRSK